MGSVSDPRLGCRYLGERSEWSDERKRYCLKSEYALASPALAQAFTTVLVRHKDPETRYALYEVSPGADAVTVLVGYAGPDTTDSPERRARRQRSVQAALSHLGQKLRESGTNVIRTCGKQFDLSLVPVPVQASSALKIVDAPAAHPLAVKFLAQVEADRRQRQRAAERRARQRRPGPAGDEDADDDNGPPSLHRHQSWRQRAAALVLSGQRHSQKLGAAGEEDDPAANDRVTHMPEDPEGFTYDMDDHRGFGAAAGYDGDGDGDGDGEDD